MKTSSSQSVFMNFSLVLDPMVSYLMDQVCLFFNFEFVPKFVMSIQTIKHPLFLCSKKLFDEYEYHFDAVHVDYLSSFSLHPYMVFPTHLKLKRFLDNIHAQMSGYLFQSFECWHLHGWDWFITYIKNIHQRPRNTYNFYNFNMHLFMFLRLFLFNFERHFELLKMILSDYVHEECRVDFLDTHPIRMLEHEFSSNFYHAVTHGKSFSDSIMLFNAVNSSIILLTHTQYKDLLSLMRFIKLEFYMFN